MASCELRVANCEIVNQRFMTTVTGQTVILNAAQRNEESWWVRSTMVHHPRMLRRKSPPQHDNHPVAIFIPRCAFALTK